ncbi:MAG TPA: peptide-methionine (S)-S-oxide reductase MsrA [Candidatus Limnocylindrales bacterium]|nr:peptide-methionine (S)-S-oxide reductase MsrA [Candidatus Limnocylindrales bacterium]
MSTEKTIYLAGGCFWGLEELFRHKPGITDTEVGYTGGENQNPDYHNHPGHAEALAITYDPEKTTYAAILDFFFRIHDPTTMNRQGNDIGSSYRSAIFYQDDDELAIAKDVIRRTNESKIYDNPVVTTLEKLRTFYTAESYHQDYLQANPGGYTCHYIRTETSLLG